MASAWASAVSFAPDDTPDGELPPWEVAKAFAFKVVLDKVAETRKLIANPPSPPLKMRPQLRRALYSGRRNSYTHFSSTCYKITASRGSLVVLKLLTSRDVSAFLAFA